MRIEVVRFDVTLGTLCFVRSQGGWWWLFGRCRHRSARSGFRGHGLRCNVWPGTCGVAARRGCRSECSWFLCAHGCPWVHVRSIGPVKILSAARIASRYPIASALFSRRKYEMGCGGCGRKVAGAVRCGCRAAPKLQTFFDCAHTQIHMCVCIYLHNKIAEICKVTEPEQTHFCAPSPASPPLSTGSCGRVYYARPACACECIPKTLQNMLRHGRRSCRGETGGGAHFRRVCTHVGKRSVFGYHFSVAEREKYGRYIRCQRGSAHVTRVLCVCVCMFSVSRVCARARALYPVEHIFMLARSLANVVIIEAKG